jgi:peptide methionine sulfoxide reductase msrA/msrB
MKLKYAAITLFVLAIAALAVQQGDKQMAYRELTPEEKYVIIDKGTEAPFTGKYLNNTGAGTYVCKRCGAPLYRSGDKFDSHCGWPSFDDEIPQAVKRVPDADGIRTEIICANCGAHLGHVFTGEGLTDKNIRHCVNSISLVFVPAAKADLNDPNNKSATTPKAYFAGGCFWGVDYWFRSAPGVISVRAGFMGGNVKHPTYEQVCTGKTGHSETVEVVFDPNKITYEDLARLFFEIHDPTQRNRQGPDVGYQYRSAVFYADQQQKEIANRLIDLLRKKGLKVVTSVEPACGEHASTELCRSVESAKEFWPAEDHHQNYYGKNGGAPYCHIPVKRF